MKPTYSMPVQIRFGDGACTSLPDLPCVKSAKRIALFVGKHTLERSPELRRVIDMIGGKKIHEQPPPSSLASREDLIRATAALRLENYDCILAIGGGSVIDLAKAAALCAKQKAPVETLLEGLPEQVAAGIPLVAVPTTAGTGSEVTPFAVLWDIESKKKLSFQHAFLFPTHAIVDPTLTINMPGSITGVTGMDAFTQACEAYWNRNSTAITDDYALTAIRRIAKSLPRVMASPDDVEMRSSMMLGSLEAGLAFSHTRTTACHSISYPMTAHFGVVHGQAVSITLAKVLALNADVQPDRIRPFCEALGVRSMSEASDAIGMLLTAAGLSTRLSDVGITEKDIDLIVREGCAPERMTNTPYTFTADSLRALLVSIL